jgi:uncharacterized repeat protein (TIGR01451 family)
LVGLVAFSTPAFAQDNAISPTASCTSPLGSGVQITWTIGNGLNLSETGSATMVTGGLGTLHVPTYAIPASPGQPSETATLTQTLPAGTTGVITLDIASTWSNGVSETDSGSFDLSTINCAAPVQSIQGHIYLCNNGNPTTTEETGGMLAAQGTGLSVVPPTLNPLAPVNVIAGTYSMTASSPPGFQLVTCGGSSGPTGAGTSATESVSVPSGGVGVGVFYATPSSPPGSAPPTSAPDAVAPTTTPSAVTPTTTATPTTTTKAGTGLGTGSLASTTGAAAVPPPTSTGGSGWTGSNKPSITLKKSASISSYWAAGTRVHYSYKVTNTGNVTLDPVTVTDPMPGLSAISCPDTSLASWVSETCTATYTTTQADVDRGSLQNTGTATGTPPSGPNVTAQSSVCIPACQHPAITLKKSASIASFRAPATTVDYSYKVTNTGNVTLDPVTVTDPMAGLSAISCPATSLAPGASETCTATYTTTQADVDRGSLQNTGTATGTPPSGPNVTAQSSVWIPAVQTPSISVIKLADVPTVSTVGQVVTYSFTVANTGNVTLSNVDITDAQASPSLASSLGTITCVTGTNGSITLAPAATDTCSAPYTVTQADLTNESITDTATVTGQPPNQLPPVTDTSTFTLSVTSVSVVKSASPSGGVVAGSATPIVYTLTVTNTGSATTTAPIVVTDAAPVGTTLVAGSPTCAKGGPPSCTVTVSNGTITWTIPAGVAPGASYTLTYLVTADATDATGVITNTASWSGPGCSAPVTTTCPTNTVTTPVTAAPVTTPAVTTAITASTPPPSTPPKAPTPTPALAFTGAPLTREWIFGVGEVLIGAALLAAARWRRRSPRVVAAEV